VTGAAARLAIACVVLVPIALVLCMRKPVWALGLMVAAQSLDAFQVATPLATISVRTMLIVILAVRCIPMFLLRLPTDRILRISSASLLLWFAVYPLRMIHTSPDTVGRGLITTASFLAIALIGAALPNERQVL